MCENNAALMSKGDNSHRVCFLVLSGIPGSGKSSLARSLKTSSVKLSDENDPDIRKLTPNINENIKSSSKSPQQLEAEASYYSQVASDPGKEKCHIFLISYDELIPEDRELEMIQSGVDSVWKTSREKIINCVESLVECLSSSDRQLTNVDKPIDDDALWDRFCDVVEIQGAGFTDSKGDNSRLYVLVIDDNMYYRSMRYKYFQLARKYEQGFCQVHLRCTEELAKERNSKRQVRRVPDEVISTMATKMEVPDSLEFPWEKYFLILESSSNFQSQLCDIDTLVRSAMLDPPRSLLDDSAERGESRQICSVNQLHQADQVLRKLVSARIKDTGTAMSQQKRGQLAKFCSVLKSQILKELRTGDILVPTDIPTFDASKMENCQFYKFVEAIFITRTQDGGY
ncbi:L-seryl-tRNA(Sec) kinase-like [Pecten maximus]|uniref:L-seryl-tRNA(Sec) kinase-like n=1 Tax=Pecten maximus TaxID=6579 RepID=UPI001457F88A|nr:L-seryl-tRNA(Sec) kinase-like [Pecten maximus]XP_033757141.1 L-seryl-tRNA(Sec) kinase-like [Pecten maximus]